MPKRKNETEDLDLGPGTALAIQGQVSIVDLPTGIDVIDKDTEIQQVEADPQLMYISIRQKNYTGDAGIEWKTSYWKIHNSPKPRNDLKSLKLTVLYWTNVRTYFPTGAEKPLCKSIDGINGAVKTEEMGFGKCTACRYGQFPQDPKAGEKTTPACSIGRNLYCFVEEIGPAIVRLGVSSCKPWDTFDNLMKAKQIAHKGQIMRVPWYYSIVEFKENKPVDRPGYERYWIVEPIWTGFHKDKETIDFLRTFVEQRERYDETARKVDLEQEDINGRASSSESSPVDGKLPWEDND